MKEFECTVLMEPVGKARPRTIVRDGMSMTYTPHKTVEAEMLIQASLWNERQKSRIFFAAGTPLQMELTFYVRRATSVKRVYPTTRPDWDNLGKLVSDALEHIVYENDAQIVDVKVSKRYALPGKLPCVVIRVRELEG